MKRRFGNMTWIHKKTHRNNSNPDREFIKKSVDDYLNSGGKITKIEKHEMTDSAWDREADFYLKGEVD